MATHWLCKKPVLAIVFSCGILCYLLLSFLFGDAAEKRQHHNQNQHQSDLDHQLPAQCTPPPNRPRIQYALMLDAGSTGSRIHVYKFHYCNGSSPTLIDELFHMVKPGLSSYADSPLDAAMSLDALLDKAVQGVPKELHSCTPVAVKATAGLRLIGPTKSEAILNAVRHRLQTNFPFSVVETDGVAVMDGKDEGVFAWITVNYLLNKIGQKDRKGTAAIMDLGGGSTQIVFEPNSPAVIAAEQHKTHIEFGGHKYVLYQHSYLGYGLMEARRKLLEASIKRTEGLGNNQNPQLPCLPKDKTMADPSTSSLESKPPIQVKGTGAGFPACSQFVSQHLFDKSAPSCPVAPCSWDGVHQPKLSLSFPDGLDIYAFSYIYDRTADLGALEEADEDGYFLTAERVRQLGELVCELDGTEDPNTDNSGPRWRKQLIEAVKKDAALCLDVGYIYHLLSTGYEIPSARKLRTAKKIKGVETGWCLGATIHVLDQMMAGSLGSKGVCKINSARLGS